MNFDNEWEDNIENGMTTGPEEALQREIEKCKLLKVNQLKLRDQTEQLKEENRHLLQEIQNLRKKIETLRICRKVVFDA